MVGDKAGYPDIRGLCIRFDDWILAGSTFSGIHQCFEMVSNLDKKGAFRDLTATAKMGFDMALHQTLAPAHSIFICYRHDDARYAADILEAKLRDSFGDGAVFRDLNRIPGGADVEESISRALRTCRVGVVVIGSRWLTLQLADGTRRIDRDDVFVRMEISALLSFKRRRTIPVYVDGANALRSEDLPPSLSNLTRLNALSVRHGTDLRSDLERVVDNVRNALENWSASAGVQIETRLGKPLDPKRSASRKRRSLGVESVFSRIKRVFVPLIWDDIAVDLGTSNTRIYVKGRGLVLREPSVAAVQAGTNRVISVGEDAKQLIGRTPSNVVAVRPIKHGAIADDEVTETMLQAFFWKVNGDRAFKAHPRVVLSVPSGSTEAEKRIFREVARFAGACEVYLIEQPIAAAIGIGLTIHEPYCNCVVNSGAGVTEASLIALSSVFFSLSERVAGDDLDLAIVRYLKNGLELLIGERTAEEIKIKIGSAHAMQKETSVSVQGRDLRSGQSRTIVVTSQEVREALREPISRMVELVRVTLERCPPELAEDVLEAGIFLTGGSALLRGLDAHVAEQTGLRVHAAGNTTDAVAEGAGLAIDQFLRPK